MAKVFARVALLTLLFSAGHIASSVTLSVGGAAVSEACSTLASSQRCTASTASTTSATGETAEAISGSRMTDSIYVESGLMTRAPRSAMVDPAR